MFEMLVGLHVTDSTKYEEYRHRMTPILHEFGGVFAQDFIVEKALIAPSEKVNRVFTIRFLNEQDKENFFNDTEYQSVKKEYFNASVAEFYILSEYQV